MKTNNELGAVYLEVEGLDKKRFKELTKGMKFYEQYFYERKYVEYCNIGCGFKWYHTNYPEKNSRKITLDELEELLHGTKPKPTHFAISPEDYEEYQELKKLKEQLKKLL